MSRICLCLWPIVLSSLAACGMILPPDLKRIMANVNSLDSFLKAFDLGNITLVPRTPPKQSIHGLGVGGILELRPNNFDKFPQNKNIKRTKLKTVAVGRTRVVSFHDSNRPLTVLEEAPCKPYPTVVEVPQPNHHRGIHYPLNVMLHRCAGSCNTKPRVQECAATATENISMLAFLVSWNSPSDSKNKFHQSPRIIPIANHTQCGCRCIAKPSDCDPATQIFSQDNCRCECRASSKPCPAYHRWDRVR